MNAFVLLAAGQDASCLGITIAFCWWGLGIWGNSIYQQKGYAMTAHTFLWGALFLGAIGLVAALAAPPYNEPRRATHVQPSQTSIQARLSLPPPLSLSTSPDTALPSAQKSKTNTDQTIFIVFLFLVLVVFVVWLAFSMHGQQEDNAKPEPTPWDWLQAVRNYEPSPGQLNADQAKITSQILKAIDQARTSIRVHANSFDPTFDGYIANAIFNANRRGVVVTLAFDRPFPATIDPINQSAPSIPIYVFLLNANQQAPNPKLIIILDGQVYIDYKLWGGGYMFLPYTNPADVKRGIALFDDFKEASNHYVPQNRGSNPGTR